ncbi:MAG: hypothetical protein R3272_09010 [Candidatus Promineifilaceae bacterium]|nr:hypothetical protein [Candidatus Promineifilaceae bacterium]
MEKRNQLRNGELDRDYGPYRNDEELQTAAGWAPWWQAREAGEPEWKHQKPHYAPVTLDERTVQRLETPYGTHVAGLWQQVPAAPGNRYELSVSGQAWSSEDPERGSQRESSDVNLQIGVDPTGGLDPASPIVEWSNVAEPHGYWETLRLSVEAQAAIITVFLRSAPTLPKRQQVVFWRDALLLPGGEYRRSMTIVGPGDTHITVTPEHPHPEEQVSVAVSSIRNFPFVELLVWRPDEARSAAVFHGSSEEDGRTIWRYTFLPDGAGLYDLRFVGDRGARLLSQRLVRISRHTQLVPSNLPREEYRRVYVLLPPTATEAWAEAAARGSYAGRYTIGFSADDAGIGDLEERHVIAVNPHHWPGILTDAWFKQNYPGTRFIPVVANAPRDLESWLRNWQPE